MKLTKFKLLMWKNYRLRRFHWIVTLIEFVLPVLITYALVKISSPFLTANTTSKMNKTVYSSISKPHFVKYVRYLSVYYAPSNPVTDELMNQTGNQIESIHGYANEAELEHAVAGLSDENSFRYIGIYFNNIVSNESLPDKLRYTLRNTFHWNTRELYLPIVTPGPFSEDFYIFLAPIQLLINENFIKMKTNYTPSSRAELEFEMFPYPEYTSDGSPRFWISLGFGFLVMIIILIVSIPLINDIIEEKDSGVKELMKIAGLDEWIMWFNWFVHALIVSFVSLTAVTIILTIPFNGAGSEAIHFVQFSVLWLFMILYCIANISYCFMFSSIFQKASIASSVFFFSIIVLVGGTIRLMISAPNNPLLKFVTITPVGAFILGFNKIRYYEMQGIEFTWSSVEVSENNDNSVSLLFCLFMLIFDTCLYFFLAFYIISINPGKFGARKSPLFIFEAVNFRKNKMFKELKRLFPRSSKDDTQPLKNLDDNVKSKFFESPPTNVQATMQIKDLHKRYGRVNAVRGVDLNIYQGELTALLGHNGAGKTTTISMMTGLTSPNTGSIIRFKNTNILDDMEGFRQKLGMCPQENRTLPYLSAMEHLLFFGQLKGVSQKVAEIEANEYLTMMEMQSKKNALAKELSGGMKRKLCLSMALMGKAEVLILDEPTSGMDVQSRRKLWDLLLNLRGKRTIIFTTHYMEEADALGDRIAIMNHGVIVCHGTPIFLKKAYGTGYELTITKISDQHSHRIDQVIKNVLPDASREFESSSETVYKLPLTETEKFPTLFKNLESEMMELNIDHMGVAATTMEHVFLKVADVSIYDAKAKSTKNTTVTDSTRQSDDSSHYARGLSLCVRQFAALFKKKYLYTSRNLFNIVTRIIFPTLVGMFILSQLNKFDFSPDPPLDLSMTTYPSSTVVLRNNVGSSNFTKHLSEYVSEQKGFLINADDTPIEEELLKDARNDILKYNRNYISAFELNSTVIKVLYNPPLLHSLPISINTYSNVLLRSITNNNRYQIETINHPVPKEQYDEMCGLFNYMAFTFTLFFYFIWFFALAFYTIDLTSYFSVFANTERIDGFQHIQMMSNVSPLVYWIGTLMFDMAFFLVVMVVRVGCFKIINHSDFLGLDASLGVFVLMIILYGICGLLFTYVTGYLSSSKEGSYALFFILNVICCIFVAIFYAVDKYNDPSEFKAFYKMLFYVFKALIYAVPSLNFNLLFIKLMVIFNLNTTCAYCSEARKTVCESKYPIKSYLVFASKENPDGLLMGILFLLFDIVLYSVILSLINMGYVRYWFNLLKNAIYGTESTNNDEGDQDVQQEYQKVQLYKNDKSKRNQVALLVDGLRKNYINWFKPSTAVSNVNFDVKPGECFGLLGVNGAGKSTTFKMLTAEIMPTLGDSSIETIKLSTDKMQYLSMAGYCSQTNCFLEELTGREMLTMIATMRGVRKTDIGSLVDKWTNIIGLQEYQNRRCGTYSGGNKRKLCTAMSLIGDPRVVFLDEPTSGVDPVSRRNLYDVMARSKEAGQAVILTSHSMEECETLCDRLTIMVSGVMKCIGSAQHLKKRYAQGFSAMTKINDVVNFDEEVVALKKDMSLTFDAENCILKDEHKGLLYYQIKDTSLSWSSLFEKMEAIKYRHRELVEDYTLTDTTLEEVFISFAKEELHLNEVSSAH